MGDPARDCGIPLCARGFSLRAVYALRVRLARYLIDPAEVLILPEKLSHHRTLYLAAPTANRHGGRVALLMMRAL